MSGLVGMKSGWYCFRTVTTSSKQGLVTTPALLFMDATDGDCWSLVVSRVVDYQASPVGESMIYLYRLDWLRAGESEYSGIPMTISTLFDAEITAFTVELRLKGIIDAEE